MKIMLDTNILISAFVFRGKVRKLLDMLFETDCELYVSEYVDREFKRILNKKWSSKADEIYSTYKSLDFVFCSSTSEILGHLRDKKDIPILSDAIYYDVDILLTGDKDFFETDIETPQIVSSSELLELFLQKGFFYG